jgi:hypothetical protein
MTLRELLATGRTRSDIIAEFRAVGANISPALLREAFEIPAAKGRKIGQPEQARPTPVVAFMPSSAGSQRLHCQSSPLLWNLLRHSPAARKLNGIAQ